MKNYFFKARTDEWQNVIKDMSNEEAGIQVKAVWAQVTGDVPIDVPDNLKMFYKMCVGQLVSDLKEQRSKSATLAENGRKGAEVKQAKANGKSQQQMPMAKANSKCQWQNRQKPMADIETEKEIEYIPPTPPLEAKSLRDAINEMLGGEPPF